MHSNPDPAPRTENGDKLEDGETVVSPQPYILQTNAKRTHLFSQPSKRQIKPQTKHQFNSPQPVPAGYENPSTSRSSSFVKVENAAYRLRDQYPGKYRKRQ